MSGRLTLVPTPIGNLEDITLRALRVLREADVILAEDTRQTSKLLRHYEVAVPMQAFHMHNEHRAVARIVAELLGGRRIAMVTDAGTPGISDPGFLLVRACAEAGVAVETLPGPTAFVPALVNSGLPCDKFHYEGFLPQKKGRQTRLHYLAALEVTFVLYESPHRMVRCLAELSEACGHDRKAAVVREISKLHEETVRGPLSQLVAHFTANEPRGEFVVVVEGAPN
jgi:16S rRNA (cytidine1402-2'-O)-methyltransferase